MVERTLDEIALPMDWHIPEDLPCQYATNLVVQHSQHEFVISFFRATPPMLVGPPEVIREQLEQIESIRAECVCRIVVAASRMPEFISVLQKNFEVYQSRGQWE